MTGLRTRRHRYAATAAGAAALVGLGISAAPLASAHTPVWTVDCSTVSVDLTAYNKDVTNTVTVTVDGEAVLPATTFDSEYHGKLELPEHDAPLSVRLVVTAGDGHQYSIDDKKTAPVCEEPASPSPSTEPSQSAPAPSEEPGEEPSQPAADASDASSSAPAVEPAGDSTQPAEAAPAQSADLAETGGSSATPVIAGAAGVVVLAGAGIVVATRKRRAHQG